MDQIDAIFEQYALYDSACVCSFFPAVVYRVKRRNARILTGWLRVGADAYVINRVLKILALSLRVLGIGFNG